MTRINVDNIIFSYVLSAFFCVDPRQKLMISEVLVNNPQTIWIAGAGESGLRAAEFIIKTWPEAKLHIIDPQFKESHSLPGQQHQEDAIVFLLKNLNRENSPDIIIPCAPVHLAFEWLYFRVKDLQGKKMLVPESVIETLPNVTKGKDGGVYTSLANFICPDDCPETEHHCFTTGQKRPYNLHEYLATIGDHNYHSLVIISYQIFPGIGGYAPQQLFKALHVIRERKYQNFLISTSCKCHAVLHGLHIA